MFILFIISLIDLFVVETKITSITNPLDFWNLFLAFTEKITYSTQHKKHNSQKKRKTNIATVAQHGYPDIEKKHREIRNKYVSVCELNGWTI